MISVNMHEAKTKLSQLVAAALDGEEVILCSKGQPRVRLTPVAAAVPARRDLIPASPELKVTFSPGYDPAEPLSDDEWPAASR